MAPNTPRYSHDAPRAAAALTALFFAGAMAWRLCCPLTADDFLYSMVYPADHVSYGAHVSGWADILVSIKRHYMSCNGRLANFLAYPVMAMPHVLRALLCALAVTALPLLMTALAGGRRALRDPLALSAAFVLTWLLFPWRNVMQSADFLLNYVFSADAVLLCMLLWRRRQTWTWRSMMWFLPLLALSLWMHEASACCFIAWAATATLLSPGRLPRRLAALAVALAALWLCLSPGTMMRVENDMRFSLSMSLVALITILPLLLYVFVLAVKAVAGRMRRRDWDFHLPLLAGALCCVAIQMVTKAGIRSLWMAVALSLAGLLALWLEGPRRLTGRRASLWLSGMAALLLAAFSANLAYWTWRVADAQRRVQQEIARTGDNLVFADIPDPADIPGWTLYIPYAKAYTNLHHNIFQARYLGLDDRPVVVLPSAWSDLDYGLWPKIPGDNPYRGLPARPFVTDSREARYSALATYGDCDGAAARAGIPRVIFRTARFLGVPDTGVVYLNAPLPVVWRGDTLYIVFHHNANRWYFGRSLADCRVN